MSLEVFKYGTFEFEWDYEEADLKEPVIVVQRKPQVRGKELPPATVRLRGNTLSKAEQRKAIQKRARWIREKLKLIAQVKEGDIVSGSRLKYQGRHYMVIVEMVEGQNGAKVEFKNRQFRIGVNPDLEDQQASIKRAIERFYRNIFSEKVPARIAKWEKQTGLKSSGCKIRKFPARWASCSAEKVLEFQPRVMALAPKVLDYVIVHELVHTVEMSHDKRFWRLVGRHFPQWEECHERLEWEV